MHKKLLDGIMATVEGYIEIEVLHKAIPDKQIGELANLIEDRIKQILNFDDDTLTYLILSNPQLFTREEEVVRDAYMEQGKEGR